MRALLLGMMLIGCGSESAGPRTKTFGGDRPVDLHTPETLTDGKQYPLVVILHGYSSNGLLHTAYFHAETLTQNDLALFVAPEGTVDQAGEQFWNADPACCDLYGANPDDVGYLGTLVDDIVAEWPVDPDQVFFVGHSNGGFMSYRMACERADAIAGIVSLAGNAASMPAGCTPSKPVSVLHMHGTVDGSVPYNATSGIGEVGAVGSVEQWATHDGCGTSRSSTVTLDLDSTVAGAETHGETTADCPSRVAVDLWTLEGSGHLPVFPVSIAETLLDWLVAHKR